jgi:extracellular elastinolytic metalloproteinase
VSNELVAHEFGHGLSGRLTGGGTAECLQQADGRVLGEGWSDMLANWLEQRSAPIRDYTLGRCVADLLHLPTGITCHLITYST